MPDTGASLSVIKPSALKENVTLNVLQHPIRITGIGSGFLDVKNWIVLTFPKDIKHVFFVPNENFNLKEDGILGNDFFENNLATLCYKTNTLEIKQNSLELIRKLQLSISLLRNKSINKVDDKGENFGDCRADSEESRENKCLPVVNRHDDIDKRSGMLRENCFRSDGNSESFTKELLGTAIGRGTADHASGSNCGNSENFLSDSEESTEDDDLQSNKVAYDIHESDSEGFSDDECHVNSDYESESENEKFEKNGKATFLRKRSVIHATVRVDRNGLGIVPKMEIAKGIYTADCLVNAKNNEAKIQIINATEQDFKIEFPIFKMQSIEQEQLISAESNATTSLFTLQAKNRLENLLEKLNLEHLNEEEKISITEVLNEYSDVFFLKGDKLNANNKLPKLKIQIKENQKPLNLKNYRTPFALKKHMEENLEKMIENDSIEESVSPWNMPILLVAKKVDNSNEKKYRLVVDMRKLNELIEEDVFPLPLIDEILSQLGKAEYFSVLDLYSGFNQIVLDEDSRKFCSFSANGRKWQYKRMPQGLKTAPAFFSRMMENTLSGLIGVSCFLFMDDLICFGKNLKEHNQNLVNILETLRKNDLKLQSDKCSFLRKECIYLGHRVTPHGIFPDSSKFEAISNFPKPKTRKDVRSFLGLCGYYRKFIKDYGKIAAPLNKLTSINVEFKWGAQHEIAFENLKQCLINPPVLVYPDFEKEFILTTDASGLGLGAVLSQIRDGQDRPIAFASRALSDVEKRRHQDSAIEKELLAIVWSVKHFRPYLYGKHFTVFSDHQPLTFLNQMNNMNNRLMKFKMQLAEFDFEIRYKKGKINCNADALSRMFLISCDDEETRERLVKEMHSSPLGGHRAADTTVEKIKNHGFAWPNMHKQVSSFIKKCADCQQHKVYNKTKLPMVKTDTPCEPWQKCAIDIVGHLPKTNKQNEYLLTFQDLFTKFIITIPLKTQNADEVAKALAENVILSFGMPQTILSDQGANFMSKTFKNLCKLFKIKKIRTSSYRPQSNGSIERMHRACKEYLRIFINQNQDNWDEIIKFGSFAYNTSTHSSTKFTPYELLFLRKPVIPSSIANHANSKPFYSYGDYVEELKRSLQTAYQIAHDNLELTKEKTKIQVDKSTKAKEFKTGETVKLIIEAARQGRSKKLGPQWSGPWVVLDKIGEVNYKIKKGQKEKIVHGNKLLDYYGD